jgi:hypothetical protein
MFGVKLNISNNLRISHVFLAEELCPHLINSVPIFHYGYDGIYMI